MKKLTFPVARANFATEFHAIGVILDDLAGEQIQTESLLKEREKIPCEMAEPVTYAADGESVEVFRPCRAAATWRIVLRWHHLPVIPDEHLLCQRHLEIWQTFRIVENPPWDFNVIAPL